jgi:hypothetical protein
MAEYKGIKGFKVQYLDQDPVPTVAGWSAGGNMNTARNNLAGAGTQTAGLAFGGLPSPNCNRRIRWLNLDWRKFYGIQQDNFSRMWNTNCRISFWWYGPGALNATEEYDGSTWTGGGSLRYSKNALAGAGIQTAGLAVGGHHQLTAATEEYDGSAWTPGGLNTARTN